MSVDARLLDWYERELRHWTRGAHGQSESFRLGIMHALWSLSENVILSREEPMVDADAQKGQRR